MGMLPKLLTMSSGGSKLAVTIREGKMGVNNQGIMHLVRKIGGLPVCQNRRAHMGVTRDQFKFDVKQCKKCAAILAKWEAKEAA